MTKDDALKLALEVMHNQGDVGVDEWIATEAAINQALAAPVQPEQGGEAKHRDLHSHMMVVAHRAVDEASNNGRESISQKEVVRAICKAIQSNKNLLAKLTPLAAPMTEFEEAVAAVDNTLHHAIDHWQDKASEQAALLRECRFAIDTLIEKKPALAMLLCGSTTLGNLKASLHDYRVKGIFDDTPPSAQRTWVELTPEEIDTVYRNLPEPVLHWQLSRAIEAKLKELNT
jgi:hypothetical protein